MHVPTRNINEGQYTRALVGLYARLWYKWNTRRDSSPVVFVLLPKELDEVSLLGCKLQEQLARPRQLSRPPKQDSLVRRVEKKYRSDRTNTIAQMGLPRRICRESIKISPARERKRPKVALSD